MAKVRKVEKSENTTGVDKVQRVTKVHTLHTARSVDEAITRSKAVGGVTREEVIITHPDVTKIPSFRSQRKTQVAAYIRVSSTMKAQDESFENQAAYYEKLISSNSDWELVGIYGEKISGTHAENRDEFQRLIKDAMDGKIDLVLCKSVSRWARNVVDGLQSIKLLTGNGVHIYFEQEGIDTRTPGIILQLNLAASVAQSESESLSENAKWGFKNKTAQGKFWAGEGWYFGYDTKGNEFKENENGKYVRMVFDWYLEGLQLTQIAGELNALGVPTLRGNKWTCSSVGSILRNEVYVGDVIFRKHPSRNVITGEVDKDWKPKYVRNHHEGIVSRDVWDAVQKRLSHIGIKQGKTQDGKQPHKKI